jgi:Rhamnan synthesis protein F
MANDPSSAGLTWLQRLHYGFREWRRHAKSKLPFVRRRVYRKLEASSEELAHAVLTGLRPATSARLHVLKSPVAPVVGELCLFVSHAPRASLKPHVLAHLSQLLDAGIAVVLVVNTDLPLDGMDIPTPLLARLSGCVVRQNLGLDFAAWAHAHAAFAPYLQPKLVLLVNDSIIGPLDAAAFQVLLERVRSSTADVIGLTENFNPRYHLQSFFLAFGPRALEPLVSVFEGLVNLPTKDLVIAIYETGLTGHMSRLGLRCEALFPTIARNVHAPANDTDKRWQALLSAGFPFVKASVVDRLRDDPHIQRVVPEAWRQPRS